MTAYQRTASNAFDYIKQNTSVKDYVEQHLGATVKEAADGRFRTKCPIHDGDNPSSFAIRDEEGTWRCYSCGESGTIIDLYALVNNISPTSPDTIQGLARTFGLRLPERESHTVVTRHSVLRALNWIAAECYKELIEGTSEEAKTALTYLEYRFSDNGNGELVSWFDKTLDYYQIGFFSKRVLHEAKSKFSESVLKEAGILGSRGDGSSTYCQLTGRISIPFFDSDTGNVLGICGRIVPEFEWDDTHYDAIRTLQDKAKYINPVNGMVYNKSRHMFDGSSITSRGVTKVIICEGYLDAIALNTMYYGSGIAAVSASGTALTVEHGEFIKQYGDIDTVIVMTDGDSAGVGAARNSAWLKYFFNTEYFNVYNAASMLPDGQDPFDILVRKGGKSVIDDVIEQSRAHDLALESIAHMWEAEKGSDRFYRWAKSISRKIISSGDDRAFKHDIAIITGISEAKLNLELNVSHKNTSAIEGDLTFDKLKLAPSAVQLMSAIYDLKDDPLAMKHIKHSYAAMSDLDSAVLRQWFGLGADYEVEAVRHIVGVEYCQTPEASTIVKELEDVKEAKSGKKSDGKAEKNTVKIDDDGPEVEFQITITDNNDPQAQEGFFADLAKEQSHQDGKHLSQLLSSALYSIKNDISELSKSDFKRLWDHAQHMSMTLDARTARKHFAHIVLSSMFDLAGSAMNAILDDENDRYKQQASRRAYR